MKILVTGSAGFIGFHLTEKLLAHGHSVVGLDNLNNYYDVSLKLSRLKISGILASNIDYGKMIDSGIHDNYSFINLNLEDSQELKQIFINGKFDLVCHLAAQAGVRYSLENPSAYINSNIVGFTNILNNVNEFSIKKIIYASSSSVYGLNQKQPFSESDVADHPVSLYGATKRSGELLAHSYSCMFNIQTIGLRFFTVYGPWGRPDMSPFLFTSSILNDKPISVYNNGEMARDFTYIDDIVEGIYLLATNTISNDTNWDAMNPNPSISEAPFHIYNIGNGQPVFLMDYIQIIEKILKKKAKILLKPMQQGDVKETWSDCSKLNHSCGYISKTNLESGLKLYIEWLKSYYDYGKDK